MCPGYSEHLQAAISAYYECIKVHIDNDQNALAASLYLELGQALRDLGRTNESVPCFLKAARLHLLVSSFLQPYYIYLVIFII